MAKILIIEDDDSLRRTIRRALTNANHQVIEASNGLEGIQKFCAEEPEIVILDIVMPEQDGIQTIQEIRDKSLKSGVIAISGGGVRAGELYLNIAKRFGSDTVLQKPLRLRQLMAAVDSLLSVTI